MRILFFLLLFPLVLSAEIPPSSISSKQASYDGNALVLNGSVELQHPLGYMQSGSAKLSREAENAPFTTVILEDDVQITLKNRGEIHCERADFDFDNLRGKLLPAEGEMIEFLNLQTEPISLLSKEAEIEFIREDSALKVSKIKACKSVQVHYGEDFLLTAEGATFSNTKNPFVWASPHCLLTHFADQVEADRIEILPKSAKMILSSPRGDLSPSLFDEDASMHFSCRQMIWEKESHLLTLKGDVHVEDLSMGKLHCEDEVDIVQSQRGDKWSLSQIITKGKTQLQYSLDDNLHHLLICHGQMRLDQDRLLLTLESPLQQPLEYFHDTMKLTADHAQLSYAQGEKSIHPAKLLLQGNIRLSAKESSPRCAVADQFAYLPEKKKIILSTKRDSPVLFWDEEEKLTISAREIHITKGDQGESVKGIGNVRFAFSDQENSLLKRLFPFYHPVGRSL